MFEKIRERFGMAWSMGLFVAVAAGSMYLAYQLIKWIASFPAVQTVLQIIGGFFAGIAFPVEILIGPMKTLPSPASTRWLWAAPLPIAATSAPMGMREPRVRRVSLVAS